MMSILASITLFAAGLGFLYAAISDFKSWKISNTNVLLLILFYAIYAACISFSNSSFLLPIDLASAFGAAALLFVMGFLLWQFKLLGAGDAKLMFPIGLFIEWNGLMSFALFLIGFAFLATLLLRLPLPYGLSNTWPGMRLDEIRKTGKVPYGVIMVAALFSTLYLNYNAGNFA